MKTVFIGSILFIFLISCSSDQELDIPEDNNKQEVASTTGLLPENKANPMDYQGKRYYDALSIYRQQNEFPNSIAELNQQIRFLGSQFEKSVTTNKGVILFTDEIVASIMSDPDNSMIAIVQSSTLGSAAQSNLINFLQGLIVQRQLAFSISYAYIISYENTIIAESSWSQEEKDTILTISSISRYSLYSESDRKDRDWESSAGNKSAKPFFSANEVSLISIIALLQKVI